MNRLVALDLPAGESFVRALNKIWDNGDAVLPIDQRLPQIAKDQLVKRLGASHILFKNGETPLVNGFPVVPGDALVIATSGSTGEPKGVVHTHDSLRAAVVASSTRLGCSSDDHWLACLPLSHVGGLSVILRALHNRSSLTFAAKPDAETIADAIRSGANITSLVATLLNRFDVSSFRKILVGGSAINQILPANVITTYGMTETFGGVAYCGKALDGVTLKISETGEINVRGEMLFRCYRDGHNSLTNDGWYPTGDFGEIDTSGKLTVMGRRDDLIITGASKVWPIQVERAIATHQSIADVVVSGIPDSQWGSIVVAWLVVRPGHDQVSLDEIRSHVKQNLPNYCAPKEIRFVDFIPRSELGKTKFVALTANK